jgi:endonuclease/exonuclease/phosphatase family metal-dependent hydrolase
METTFRRDAFDFRNLFVHSVLFLFFLLLISDFIEATYVFGLLGTSLPTEIVFVLILFSPLILIIARRYPSRPLLIFLGELVLLCRILEVLLGTYGKMIVAGIGSAAFLLLFPAYLGTRPRNSARHTGTSLGIALSFGLALAILLKAVNSGIDLSAEPRFQFIGWVFAIVAGVFLPRSFGINQAEPSDDSVSSEGSNFQANLQADAKTGNGFRKVGLCLGLMSVFILLYFGFASPNVIARWTGADYVLVLILGAVSLSLFVVVSVFKPSFLTTLPPLATIIWNLAFVVCLIWTILTHQISFPSDPQGYPLYEPSISAIGQIAPILMLFLHPILLIDFSLFSRALIRTKPTAASIGRGFTLASLLLIVAIFGHIFTTVYDYIPVVGPFFRDKFWLIHLIVGLSFALPAIIFGSWLQKSTKDRANGDGPSSIYAVLMILISGTSVIAAFLNQARPDPPVTKISLRIVTYNILQGYSADGQKNYVGQLEVLREFGADIIGLQESDSNRIANGNTDVVRYFADQLNMYSYYGPKVVPGTFGIALLSKYPIENPKTFYMYSEGEQTASIEAQITVGGETFNLLVTHLGNGGPMVQQQAVLETLEGKSNVIALGDYNFRPDKPQYNLTTELLRDSWIIRDSGVTDHPDFDPEDRIDHIFVSPDFTVPESRYLLNPASDHPAMYTEVGW